MTCRPRIDGQNESVCDVCGKAALVGTQDDDSDKALLESAGWRWKAKADPLDTCPACLKAERDEIQR